MTVQEPDPYLGQYEHLVCTGCDRTPEEIWEYSQDATGEDCSPSEYAWHSEGTLNHENGHFLCTKCYIKAGQPSDPGGWVAP